VPQWAGSAAASRGVVSSRHEDVWDYGCATGAGPGSAKAFYVEKVGLQALESDFLQARDGQVGLTVGDGANQLFVYPARARSSGEFTQAVIHVTDVRATVDRAFADAPSVTWPAVLLMSGS